MRLLKTYYDPGFRRTGPISLALPRNPELWNCSELVIKSSLAEPVQAKLLHQLGVKEGIEVKADRKRVDSLFLQAREALEPATPNAA